MIKNIVKRTALRTNMAMILRSPQGKRTPPKLRAMVPEAKAPQDRTVPSQSTVFAFWRKVKSLLRSKFGRKKSITGTKGAAMGRLM